MRHLTLQARLWAQVAAYAAARMPGCYAAVARVLDELRLRLPDFAPASMLDFGAGPGTAIWAAREARLIWHALMRCVRADRGRRSDHGMLDTRAGPMHRRLDRCARGTAFKRIVDLITMPTSWYVTVVNQRRAI